MDLVFAEHVADIERSSKFMSIVRASHAIVAI